MEVLWYVAWHLKKSGTSTANYSVCNSNIYPITRKTSKLIVINQVSHNHDSHFCDYHNIDTNLLSRYLELSLLSPSPNNLKPRKVTAYTHDIPRRRWVPMGVLSNHTSCKCTQHNIMALYLWLIILGKGT